MALTTNLTAGDLLAVALLGLQTEDQVGFWNSISGSSVAVLADVGTFMKNHSNNDTRGLLKELRLTKNAIQALESIFPTLHLSVQDADGRGQRDLVLDLGTSIAP